MWKVWINAIGLEVRENTRNVFCDEPTSVWPQGVTQHRIFIKFSSISLGLESRKFAEEVGFTLDLSFPHPKCRDNIDGAGVPRDKIKKHLKKAAMEQRKTEVKEKKWQGKLLAARWTRWPAEPAWLLCVAEEFGYGAYTHHRGYASNLWTANTDKGLSCT